MKILVIEDEKALAESIVVFLQKEGYLCEWAYDYAGAVQKINSFDYDCVLVDIMLPDGNGLALIKELKENHSKAGIIIISAKDALDDKVKGLDLGADDYLTKPFHLTELNARLRSVIRRRNFAGSHSIEFHELKVIPEDKMVYVNEKPVALTPKEFDLLLYLLINKNRVINKSAIAEHLWSDEIELADSYDFIYSHMKNLRKKLLDAGCEDYIQTVYGMGYKFSDA
jgi:DNA-binding response OmpR family regulator